MIYVFFAESVVVNFNERPVVVEVTIDSVPEKMWLLRDNKAPRLDKDNNVVMPQFEINNSEYLVLRDRLGVDFGPPGDHWQRTLPWELSEIISIFKNMRSAAENDQESV